MAELPAPIDSRVKIPAAVTAAGKRAEELHAQIFSPELKEPEVEGDKSPEQKIAPAEQPAVEQPKEEEKKEQPKSAEPTPAPEGDTNWEHNYKSLKGRYDRQNAQLADMSRRMSDTERLLATMQASVPAKNGDGTKQERLITPQEETDYGSEFLAVVAKKAKEELLPVIARQEVVIEQLRAQLNGVGESVSQNAHQRMQDYLTTAVPELVKINTNPDFLSWLALPDPYSGSIRHDMLKAAWNANDGHRVAAFFNGFLSEEAAVAPVPDTVQPAAGVKKTPQVPLESLVAPGRAKTAATGPAEKPSFTRAQITQFYMDSKMGKYAGRDAEKLALEQQIFAAQAEGRIR